MERRTMFTIAVGVTVLNIAVLLQAGPILWQAWAGIPWCKVLILMSAGIGAFTLSDIWSQTFDRAASKTAPIGDTREEAHRVLFP